MDPCPAAVSTHTCSALSYPGRLQNDDKKVDSKFKITYGCFSKSSDTKFNLMCDPIQPQDDCDKPKPSAVTPL